MVESDYFMSSLAESSAFPPGMQAISTRRRTDTSLPDVTYSNTLHAEEMSTVRQLHAEWFPLTYDEDFFSSIAQGQVQVIAARNAFEELIALAIYRTRPLSELPGCEDFSHVASSHNVSYLMTLGVVQEWRGRGVARHLLEHLMEKLKSENSFIYLHVIDYNTTATALYRSVGFERISLKSEFYFINNRYYSAITLARFFRPAFRPPPSSWTAACLGFL